MRNRCAHLIPILLAGGALAGERSGVFPTVQAVPLPDEQVSFQHNGVEAVRYCFNRQYRRPFWFPVVGPAGRVVTRMGHPHDPMGHSHHNSVWVSHNDVNGVNFWADFGDGRIRHQAIEKMEDGPDSASLDVRNVWVGPGERTLLNERRRTTIRCLPNGELLMIVELLFEPVGGDVTFGKTPFGLFAVRVAKTMGVHDGGGTLRNSEGGVNEKGVFWKPARWVDYSGPVAPNRDNGITLMDHPANANHPSVFHVRDDGWMGASFSFTVPYVVQAGRQLRLIYALYIHDGIAPTDHLERQYTVFAQSRGTLWPTSGPAGSPAR